MSVIAPATISELEPKSRTLIGHDSSTQSVRFAIVGLKGVVCLVQSKSTRSDYMLPY